MFAEIEDTVWASLSKTVLVKSTFIISPRFINQILSECEADINQKTESFSRGFPGK